jgi:hypothetical protein
MGYGDGAGRDAGEERPTMTDRVPIFVELCAGTAALSLRLEHPRARPPVSRMGAKTGYADVILRCMGLRPGQGAESYLWCEPDAGVRLLLHAYRDRELATAAADIIRGWADEDPRALWERLRAEGPAVCPPVDAREVARAEVLGVWSFRQSQPESGFVASEAHDRPGCPGGRPSTATMAESLANAPTLPATIADDARAVDPREVARYALLGWQSYRQGFPESGFRATAGGAWPDRPPEGETVAARLEALPGQQAAIADDARAIDPPQLPPGVVVYIDPPYLDTTGYAHAFPRSQWLPVVRRWQEAGALVVVSEAEPIPELMADGWHAVRIDGERKGQKRTFSKQQAEYLTMSEPPRWRPSVQMGLWR